MNNPEEVPAIEDGPEPIVADIIATGDVTDGVITAEGKLDEVTLTLTYPVGEKGALDADTLYEAFPQVLGSVIAALEKAQAEAEAGA